MNLPLRRSQYSKTDSNQISARINDAIAARISTRSECRNGLYQRDRYRTERRFPFILQLRCVTTAKWQIDWPGQLRLADRRAKLIPAGALPGGACRAGPDGGLAADLLASRRCGAGGYGLRGEVVTEHGDPPVADAEDLHQ